MHRDAKLGLALGILVIGFAAAFCFPRKPDAGAVARNEATSPLDQQLLDKSVKLYPVAAPVSEKPPEPIDPDPRPSMQIVDTTTPPRGVDVSPPDVSHPTRETRRLALDPNEEELPGEELTVREPESAIYTVQPGDTLSSIAQRQLGGSGKYGDIFEANRDQLGSPDDLQIGMVLKIPSPAAKNAIAETPRRDRAARQPTPIPTPTPPNPPRFQVAENPAIDLGPSPATNEVAPAARVPLPTNAIQAPATPPPIPRPRSSSALRGAASVGASLGGKK